MAIACPRVIISGQASGHSVTIVNKAPFPSFGIATFGTLCGTISAIRFPYLGYFKRHANLN
jgi:hypothetical protein